MGNQGWAGCCKLVLLVVVNCLYTSTLTIYFRVLLIAHPLITKHTPPTKQA